jgi:hypothetical protein
MNLFFLALEFVKLGNPFRKQSSGSAPMSMRTNFFSNLQRLRESVLNCIVELTHNSRIKDSTLFLISVNRFNFIKFKYAAY